MRPPVLCFALFSAVTTGGISLPRIPLYAQTAPVEGRLSNDSIIPLAFSFSGGIRSLGARLSLYQATPGFLDPDQVFALSEASSAFPIAFAPRKLSYRDADCRFLLPRYTPCADSLTEEFIDGGVFDNNPVGLAYGVFLKICRSLNGSQTSNSERETFAPFCYP